MEEWNVGRKEIDYFNCEKLLQTHYFYPLKLFFYFTGALLHYSNWQQSELTYIWNKHIQ